MKDVYAHLSGVAADALAGKLDGAATDPWTAQQVSDRVGMSLGEVCAEYAENGPKLEEALAAMGDVDFRLLVDQWTHEQDLPAALGRPGQRDPPLVAFTLPRRAAGLDRHWKAEGLPAVRLVGECGAFDLGE